MASFFELFRGETYALFRIVTGFLFALHGTQKLLSFPDAVPNIPDWPLRYGAGPIEIVAGPLIMIGLFTRYSAFVASGLMAFAYWMVHGQKELFPIQNGGELAALYCFALLFISTQGGGMWSVDSLFSRNKNAESSD